jgi:hypothetical protein
MMRAAFVFVIGVALLACGGDPDRPPATGSSGVTSSSGAGSSSGGTPIDAATTDGSTSSGGIDSGTNVDPNSITPGLRASIDNAATSFDVGTKASRQSSGFVVELSGKDSFGNELRITLTNSSTAVAPGKYDCTGGSGATYGIIAYVVSGGAATWTALASGECSVTVLAIDNKVGGVVVGTFGGTAKRAMSTERLITKGQFRLTLE